MNVHQPKKNQALHWAVLLGILLAGFLIRMYDLKDPPLDFHSTRQLRSYLIARAVFYRDNPAYPEAVQRQAVALADLEVYEPPILEQLVGWTYRLVGEEQFWLARVHLAFYWVLGGVAIFLIGKRYFSPPAIWIGLAFYLFLPSGVMMSRSFQPDPWMTMWITWTAYALMRWYEQPGWKWAILAGLLGGITLLVKVVAGAFIIPMIAMVTLSRFGIRKVLKTQMPWAMIVLSIVPALIFYFSIPHERTGSFLSFWVVSFSGLLFDPGFYADWLAMVRGLMGLTVFLFRSVLAGLWVGYFTYGLVFPYQYVTHEYYHVPLIPIVALSIVPAADLLIEKLRSQNVFWQAVFTGALLFASFYSLYVARSVMKASDYTIEPASWRKVGEAIPAGSSFIALTPDYGMRLRYYGWKVMSAAWPTTGDQNLSSIRGDEPMNTQGYFDEVTAGKDYFLVASLVDFEAQPELKEILRTQFPLLVDGNGFMVFDLQHPIEVEQSQTQPVS